ncbi:hypothetical protein PI87_02940 [Ralstonia sp. A12]|uniref:hypothetical protein n=1 Tax=Ralstonia sp. A12 TaxID=1217052 RepID=UPI00057493C2|nr:hypothetical protein [Ralstonia sp. A12]KHK58705.1 hypothetical protein PI87_02940 [Ralstonia sp. A12]
MINERGYGRVIEYIEWSRNTEGKMERDDQVTTLLPSFNLLGPTLIKLEDMARSIGSGWGDIGFEIAPRKRGREIAVPSAFGKEYFPVLKRFQRSHAFAGRYIFSDRVEAVREALMELGLFPDVFTFAKPNSRDARTSKRHAEIFNEVIAKTTEIMRSPQFEERMQARCADAKCNEAMGLAIERQAFEAESQRAVLLLTMGYQEQHRRQIKPDEIEKHRQALLDLCGTDVLLSRIIVDYIWTQGEGAESGLHLQMMLFLTADSLREHHLPTLLGAHWRTATGGKGQCWHDNAHAALHQKYDYPICTGIIDRYDEERREALRMYIHYMTNADQLLCMPRFERCAVFGTSLIREVVEESVCQPAHPSPGLDTGATASAARQAGEGVATIADEVADDFPKIHEFIECMRNADGIEFNGQPAVARLPSFNVLMPLLVPMEEMARDIASSEARVSFKDTRYFYALKRFQKHCAFSDRYVFSPHVETIRQALYALGLYPDRFAFGEPDAYDRRLGKPHRVVFDEVVDKAQEILRSAPFANQLRAHQHDMQHDEAMGLAVERQVFAAQSTRTVLMLSFGYCYPDRAQITPTEIQAHSRAFLELCRTDPVLSRVVVDDIWMLDGGEESGLRLHVLFFCTEDTCHDFAVSDLLGEVWLSLTGDVGQWWNGYPNKGFHAKHRHGVFMGAVDWRDQQKRQALRRNIRYMAQASRYLRMSCWADGPLFGTRHEHEALPLERPHIA